MGIKTLNKKPPARSTHNTCKQNEIAGGFPSGLAFSIDTSVGDKDRARVLLQTPQKDEDRSHFPAGAGEYNRAPDHVDVL